MKKVDPASFRDPSGFVFFYNNSLYRQINNSYREDYNFLMESGLYEKLVGEGLLISHEEDGQVVYSKHNHFKTIVPERVPFVSYPYEWTFGQLKDAAKVTLEIQKIALKYEMTLKDASPFNVQFHRGKPILIDTLSFERRAPGKPWRPYKQFCEAFLAPLALMSYKDLRFSKLSRIYINGIPLDLTMMLLPLRAVLNKSVLIHLYLHNKSQIRYQSHSEARVKVQKSINRKGLEAIIDSLGSAVDSIKYPSQSEAWTDYYENTNYKDKSFEDKKRKVMKFVEKADPKAIWDLGANDGFFSRLVSNRGVFTLSIDNDHSAVEENYNIAKENRDENILPLVMDVANPTPGLGWDSAERKSLIERGPADMVLFLALMHHLYFTNNIGFGQVFDFLKKISSFVLIEFVEVNDENVKKIKGNRMELEKNYNKDNFETEMLKSFKILSKRKITGSKRWLYLIRKK